MDARPGFVLPAGWTATPKRGACGRSRTRRCGVRMGMTASFLSDGRPSESSMRDASVRALYDEQRESPVFDAALLHADVRSLFHGLQAATPPAFLQLQDAPEGTPRPRAVAAHLLAQRRIALCAAARRELMLRHAQEFGPAGALSDAGRREACWRDLNAYARVLGYMCVAPDGLSRDGVAVMRKVYGVRGIRLSLAVDALAAMKSQALQDAQFFAPDFDCLHRDVERELDVAFSRFASELED